MIIGIPKETKQNEKRVGMMPEGVKALSQLGHQVLVESSAGEGSGFSNKAYQNAGATIVDQARIWCSDLIVKVKEPQFSERSLLKPHSKLFCYLHLAASEDLTKVLMKSGTSCYAYETLKVGKLTPLLAPMSDIAGQLAVERGATFMNKLMYSCTTGDRAHVTIVGAGVAGLSALLVAANMGAEVTVFDINLNALISAKEELAICLGYEEYDYHRLDDQFKIFDGKIPQDILSKTDLLIGTVHVPGKKAIKVLKIEDLKHMKKGSVVVDVAIDQGGCFESSAPTTHSRPTYELDGVIHYCVANMPGCVPHTSTKALCNATLPFIKELVTDPNAFEKMYPQCCNVKSGQIVNDEVKTLWGNLYDLLLCVTDLGVGFVHNKNIKLI